MWDYLFNPNPNRSYIVEGQHLVDKVSQWKLHPQCQNLRVEIHTSIRGREFVSKDTTSLQYQVVGGTMLL